MMRRTDFLDVFYNSLFHPVREFRAIAKEMETSGRMFITNHLLLYGLLAVLFISALTPLTLFIQQNGDDPGRLIMEVPLSVLAGLCYWLFIGSIISLLSYTFTGQARLGTFLVLSALASLPLVFLPALVLFKTSAGLLGAMAGIAGGFLVWLWSGLLFALALAVTYQLSLDRVLILFSMPFLFCLVALVELVGFIMSLQQMM